MSFWGHVADVATGGIYSAAGGSGGFGDDIKGALGGGSGDPAPVASPPAPAPPDYSPVMLAESNNGKETAIAQINTEEMALQQQATDQDMKHASDMELALDKFDVHMQTSLMEYRQGMVAEQDRHIEKMYARGYREYSALTQTSLSLDLPPPSDSDPSKKTS